jgi:hypothetical protein
MRRFHTDHCEDAMHDLAAATWVLHPDNPLIYPEPPNWLLGDPAVVTPDRAPDGRWHLFCNTLRQVMHYAGEDGLKWEKIGPVCRGMRAFVFKDGETFCLFYELHAPTYHRSRVMARTSADLLTWSDQTEIVGPKFAWDGRVLKFVGNPCVVKVGEKYRLYYSTSCIVLADTLVTEPKYIGVAEADHVLGPYRRHPVPLFGPEPDHPWRNRGAGSIKVYPREGGGFWAFNNGIYRDKQGRHGSAIMALASEDGYRFSALHDGPIIAPGEGWTRAFVYAFDLVEYGGQTRLYFNARDGWAKAKEHIGLATASFE